MTGTGPISAREAARARLLAEIHAHLDELARLGAEAPAPGLRLGPTDCAALEEITGLGTTRSVVELLAGVSRLASIAIGDVRLPFTPGQLEELKHRAIKRGHTVEEEMKQVVARIQDELFYKGA